MKYYIIAGEASGDLHGANLMSAIKQQDAHAEFRFWGGDNMQAQGGTMVKHYKEMAFMGFVEVALHLKQVLGNIKECKSDIVAYQPDVVILVDFPGFNLRIAEFAKKQGFKTYYYIAPKVWAWNQKRVKKIKQSVDKLFCILPFEVDFFKQHGVDIHYIGNPLLDAIKAHKTNPSFLVEQQLNDKPIIALLAGSRKMEINKLLPLMVNVSKRFKDYQFVVAGAPSIDKDLYNQYLSATNIRLIYGHTYDILQNATAAIVTSGTATLETALFKVPQLVVYRMNGLTYQIAKRLVKVDYISLVNLIANKGVVKEFIQDDCNTENVAKELSDILKKEKRYTEIMLDYTQLLTRMGDVGASDRAAKIMVDFLK